MKFKRIAAIISAAAVALTLTACGSEFKYKDNEAGKEGVVITEYKGKSAEVQIPSELGGKKVTGIFDKAFTDNTSLTSVTISNSVTEIGGRAFYGCENLTNVIIPDSVTAIGSSAFGATPWLENKRKENPLVVVNNILIDGQTCSGDVTIPNSVIAIGGNAFFNCKSCTSITIPDSVIEIDGWAFYGCKSLTNVILPDSVNVIGEHAFDTCESLAIITIPDSVTEIGEYAFFLSHKLKASYKGKTYDYAHIDDLYKAINGN